MLPLPKLLRSTFGTMRRARPRRSDAPLVFVVALAAGCGGSALAPEYGPDPSWSEAPPPPARVEAPSFRLPPGATPTLYRLELQIDPAAAEVVGTTEIDLALAGATTTVFLHAKGVSVEHASVRRTDGTVEPATFEPEGEDDLVRVAWARPLGPGPVTLRFRHRAPILDGGEGLFRREASGERYVFTQFEPTDARRVFPSFDEPGWKTPFEVTLLVRGEHAAIGNTPVEREEPLAGGWKRLVLGRTQPLPTYLLAWAVGPLDVVAAADVPPNEVRTRALALRGVAVRGRGPELARALGEIPAILDALERYFGTEYPYEKLDVIAIPDWRGAMENAGAITFSDYLLLLGDAATARQRQYYFYTAAHELAHQWFGDLVTMRWWDDLWLNEAFASWMEHRIASALRPDDHADTGLVDWGISAMEVDALPSARRIREPVRSIHDIHNAFDGITYGKGAAVLRMVERFAGEAAFRDAVRRYLGDHAGGSATADDFIAALDAETRDAAGAVLRSFLDQPGVPLVELSPRCEGAALTLEATQRRYAPLGIAHDAASTWRVPLFLRSLTHEASATPVALLEGPVTTLRYAEVPCDAPLVPNLEGSGYYRWSLPPRALDAVVDHLGTHTAAERLSALDSVIAGFRAGRVELDALLQAFGPAAADDERSVLELPLGTLDLLTRHLVADPARDAARALVRRLYAPRAQRLGLAARPGETDEAARLRVSVVGAAVELGRDARLEGTLLPHGRGLLGLARPPRTALAPDLRGLAIAVAVRRDGAPAIDASIARLLPSEDSGLREALVRGLGSIEAPAAAAHLRARLLEPGFRTREIVALLRAQLAEPPLRAEAWAWLVASADALWARLGEWQSGALASLPESACDLTIARAEADFLGPRVAASPGGPRDLAGAVESAQICAALRARHGAAARARFARTR